MPNKIQDIITIFKGQTFSSHEEVVKWLESSLTSLLDSIEKELPEEHLSLESSDYKSGLMSLGHNECRQEVIQIINSFK